MAQSITTSNPFAVDAADELPVGLQLTLRLRALIATGRLPAGERLPSVRQLAEWAGVNLNTVRGVYAGLEGAGLVVSRQGRGTFVADGVSATPELKEIAAAAIRQAEAAGLSARELAEVTLVGAEIPPAPPGPPAGDAIAGLDTAEAEAISVRRELRRQIGVLEAELAEFARDVPLDMPTAPRVTSAHVAGVGEPEQTRDTWGARPSEARRAAEGRAREEARRAIGAARGTGTGEAGPLARAM